MFSVAHNEAVDLKCQRNERHDVTVTFLALKRECHDNVLDSVHFSAVTTCQHASDMFIRDDVTCGSLLASSLTFPFRRPFVGPSSALCARTQRQLILPLISFPASRGCARAIIWTLCRRVATTLFPAIGNAARNLNLYISAREHEKCSLA